MNEYVDFVNYNISMLTDKARTELYRKAILKTVRAGDVVLDLGTGSGILAFFACQAGARKVYAIESENVIEIAKELAVRNRVHDRITFIKDRSFSVELPEQVDVLITETMGVFGLDEGLLASVIDARNRFLKKTGIIVPESVEVFVVPVELPEFYEHMVEFWSTNRYGVDFSVVRSFVANNFHPIKLHEEALLCEPVSLVGRMTLLTQQSPAVHRELSFYAGRGGRLHGLAGWFDAQLTRDLMVSNSPRNINSHWGLAFFPIEHPVALSRGSRIVLAMEGMENGKVWKWKVEANGQKFVHQTVTGFPVSNSTPI